jgi:hypothetical protein
MGKVRVIDGIDIEGLVVRAGHALGQYQVAPGLRPEFSPGHLAGEAFIGWGGCQRFALPLAGQGPKQGAIGEFAPLLMLRQEIAACGEVGRQTNDVAPDLGRVQLGDFRPGIHYPPVHLPQDRSAPGAASFAISAFRVRRAGPPV